MKSSPREVKVRADIYELITGDVIPYTRVPSILSADQTPSPVPEINYKIIGSLSNEYSSGYSYLAQRIQEGGDEKPHFVFIKTPRLSQKIPVQDLLRVLNDATETFQAEWDNRDRIEELNREEKVAAAIEAFALYRVKDVKRRIERHVPYLVQEYIDEFSVEKYFENSGNFLNSGREFKGITDPAVWFELAWRIAEILRRLHNRQIVHGEFVPKNILLTEDNNNLRPIIVDFGNSFSLDASSGLLATAGDNDPYLAPERQDGKGPWYTPADIYALGGVLFYLAVGEAPPNINSSEIFESPASWADPTVDQVNRWKEVIHEKFAANPGLMERNEGIVKIIDKCLRPNPNDRFSSADKVIQALHAVNYAERDAASIDQELERLNTLRNTIKEEEVKKKCALDPVFASVLSDKLQMIQKELSDMANGHFEIYGEREDIIDTLVKYVGVLKPSDSYLTVTVPEYWTEYNLGVNGRFLTVNKDLARNGAFVNRLFLICQEDLEVESESRRILMAHLKAWQSLAPQHQATRFVDDKSGAHCGKMFIGALIVDNRHDIIEIQKRLNHVAIWQRPKEDRRMAIIFNSIPIYRQKDDVVVRDGSQIVKVRFRALYQDSEYDDLVEQFKNPQIQSLSEIDALVEPR